MDAMGNALVYNTQTLERFSQEYNRIFGRFVSVGSTINVLSVRPLPYSGNARVRYQTQTHAGVVRVREVTVQRYPLWGVLAERLPKEEVGLRLYVVHNTLTEILAAVLQQAQVALTGEDVLLDDVRGQYVRLKARSSSLGWYGDVTLRLVQP